MTFLLVFFFSSNPTQILKFPRLTVCTYKIELIILRIGVFKAEIFQRSAVVDNEKLDPPAQKKLDFFIAY